MYRDILLATDGSDSAQRATDHAIELADRFDATLHIVSVSEEGAQQTRDKMRADPEEEATTAIERAKETAENHGFETATTVGRGIPQEEIITIAETNDIDMIIMGTVGRTGLDHVLMGSVAEEVIRNASVPVVTVKAEA